LFECCSKTIWAVTRAEPFAVACRDLEHLSVLETAGLIAQEKRRALKMVQARTAALKTIRLDVGLWPISEPNQSDDFEKIFWPQR